MFGCKAAAGGQLLTCWHKTEKGNRAVRPCPGGAAHARGGRGKNWCLDCAGPRLRLSYSTARAPGAGAAQCVQPRWDAGTGCRKNGELETRGKWELPERSGARAARAGARPLEGEGWQKLLKGLGPGGAPKGQEGGAVLAAHATRRSRSLSPDSVASAPAASHWRGRGRAGRLRAVCVPSRLGHTALRPGSGSWWRWGKALLGTVGRPTARLQRRRAQSRPPVSVVRAGRAGDGRRGRVQVVVTTGAAGRRAARGARVVSLPRASGARHLRLEEHEQAAIAVKNGLQLRVAQG